MLYYYYILYKYNIIIYKFCIINYGNAIMFTCKRCKIYKNKRVIKKKKKNTYIGRKKKKKKKKKKIHTFLTTFLDILFVMFYSVLFSFTSFYFIFFFFYTNTSIFLFSVLFYSTYYLF